VKSHTKYLWFNAKGRREYTNITAEVEKAVAESGIREGTVLVSAMRITAYADKAHPAGLKRALDFTLEKSSQGN